MYIINVFSIVNGKKIHEMSCKKDNKDKAYAFAQKVIYENEKQRALVYTVEEAKTFQPNLFNN